MSLLILLGGGGGGISGMAASTSTGLNGIMVAGGTEYSAHAEFRADSTGRDCRVYINWYDEDGAELSFSAGDAVVDTNSAWTKGTVTDTSPADAVYAAVVVAVVGASSSEVHYVDKVGLYLRSASPEWDPGEPGSRGDLTALFWMGVSP